MEPSADVDAMVADAVRTVRDRFGADGLRDLVALATASFLPARSVSLHAPRIGGGAATDADL